MNIKLKSRIALLKKVGDLESTVNKINNDKKQRWKQSKFMLKIFLPEAQELLNPILED